MSDYIDRQAAIDALGMAIDVDDFRTATGLIHEATVSKVLDCIPAADVAPVVHSTWIENGDPLMLTCGNCGYGVMRYNNTRFCPNCCAKMDGGESDG